MAWKKGQSGNPRGRKAGITARGHFRKQVDAALPGIVKNLVNAAEAGDMAATKIILDRCIPALKPTSDTLTIPSTGSLVERGEAIIKAVSAGECTPDAALAVMSVIAAQAKLTEQSELIARIERLEATQK